MHAGAHLPAAAAAARRHLLARPTTDSGRGRGVDGGPGVCAAGGAAQQRWAPWLWAGRVRLWIWIWKRVPWTASTTRKPQQWPALTALLGITIRIMPGSQLPVVIPQAEWVVAVCAVCRLGGGVRDGRRNPGLGRCRCLQASTITSHRIARSPATDVLFVFSCILCQGPLTGCAL